MSPKVDTPYWTKQLTEEQLLDLEEERPSLVPVRRPKGAAPRKKPTLVKPPKR